MGRNRERGLRRSGHECVAPRHFLSNSKALDLASCYTRFRESLPAVLCGRKCNDSRNDKISAFASGLAIRSVLRSCSCAALIGDVWTLLLIRDLENGPRRFSELEASTGISPRVLTDRLRELLARGMVTRHMFNEIPPRVEYTLTEKGLAACPVVDALRAYGDAWLMSDECPKSDHPETTVPPFEAIDDATTVANA